MFLDSMALTFGDPDHSDAEPREITIGISTRGRVLFLSHCERGDGIRIISARRATPKERKHMRKTSAKSMKDDLRPEYDLTKLKGGVRGKYYQQAQAGTNLVLVEPELAKVFPDAASVNRALRVLRDAAGARALLAKRSRRGPERRRGAAARRKRTAA